MSQQLPAGLILITFLQEKSTLIKHRESLAKDRSYFCPILETRKNKEFFCLAENNIAVS
jgi:hypothetical protein